MDSCLWREPVVVAVSVGYNSCSGERKEQCGVWCSALTAQCTTVPFCIVFKLGLGPDCFSGGLSKRNWK